MSFFVIIIIVIVFIGGGLYILNYTRRRHHHYMDIEQFRQLLRQLQQHDINGDDVNDDNAMVEDMFVECSLYKTNHAGSNLDYIRVYEYIRQFCCEKSTHTNRPGPVCPFLPRSLREQYIYFFDDIHSTNKQELIQTVRQCRQDFLSILKPIEFKNRNLVVYKCLIILLRSPSMSHRLVDEVQMELKPEFVLKHGLMLGEFHLSSNSTSIKNEDFFPLRTKVPLLVIRYLVANDILFLNQKDKYSKELRLKLVDTYFDLHKKGLLHSTKDYHLRKAYEILDELTDCNKLDNGTNHQYSLNKRNVADYKLASNQEDQ